MNIAQLNAKLDQVEEDRDSEMNSIKSLTSYDSLINEGGDGYSHYEQVSESIYNKYQPIISALKLEIFKAEWTADVIDARKAQWNSEVMKLDARTVSSIAKLSERLGYTLNDLKKAISLNAG